MSNLSVLNDKSIQVSWSPCVYFNGKKYVKGPIGRRGPGVTEEDLKKVLIITEIPKAIILNLKINSEELYHNIILFLKECEKYENIEVSESKHYNKLKIPKEEHLLNIENINQKIKERRTKINNLLEELEKLNVNIDDIYINDEFIPEEYYNVTYIFSTTISISCHSETKIYQYYLNNGTLERVFPEWYRNGNF